MEFSKMKSERLLAYYESVRRQVQIDKQTGGEFRFAGEGMKQYADQLREEMERRGVKVFTNRLGRLLHNTLQPVKRRAAARAGLTGSSHHSKIEHRAVASPARKAACISAAGEPGISSFVKFFQVCETIHG